MCAISDIYLKNTLHAAMFSYVCVCLLNVLVRFQMPQICYGHSGDSF